MDLLGFGLGKEKRGNPYMRKLRIGVIYERETVSRTRRLNFPGKVAVGSKGAERSDDAK